MKVLKYAPIVSAGVGVVDPAWVEEFKDKIKLTETLIKQAPDFKEGYVSRTAGRIGTTLYDEDASGARLRAVRALLDELDPSHAWGGLRKVLTPEGHFLWLCEHHAKEYIPPPIDLSDDQ
jgi:hypothetical protein